MAHTQIQMLRIILLAYKYLKPYPNSLNLIIELLNDSIKHSQTHTQEHSWDRKDYKELKMKILGGWRLNSRINTQR